MPVAAVPEVPVPASPASVNRETAILKRCLTLAKRRRYIESVPYIQSLEEAAPREGFLGDAEYLAIRAELEHKPHAQGVLDFGFLTGWRLSEILGLTWAEIDVTRRTILLPASRNKGGVARPLHIFDQLWDVIETWHGRRLVGVPFVFHHAGGKPVKSVRSAIDKAAERAGDHGSPDRQRV